jgi:hypothetical protein
MQWCWEGSCRKFNAMVFVKQIKQKRRETKKCNGVGETKNNRQTLYHH